MSWHEEWESDYTIYDKVSAEAKVGIWTQKDGTRIEVRDMSRSHLRNTINMMKRSDNDLYDPWISVMEDELEFREYIDRIVRGEL